MSEPSIYEKAFAKNAKTDAILVVDGKQMHVNKALLSYHSDYFNTLFNSEFKEKSMEEIEIKDVNFENFATLLSLVQVNPISFEVKAAEKLLDLADRFLLPATKRFMELVLLNRADKRENLRIGHKYNLHELRDSALKLFSLKRDFKTMNSAPDFAFFKQFSDETRAKLLDRINEVCNKLLSYHSDYFNTLFNSEFKEKSMEEIEIKDVDFENFATMLSLIDIRKISPTEQNAEKLLELADRFQLLRSIKYHVELCLIKSEIAAKDKIRIADKYQMRSLLENGVNRLTSSSQLIDWPYQTFSDHTKSRIFEQMLCYM